MADKPTVVLLHGLARTHRSMSKLGKALAEAGYPTWSRTYSSREHSIEELAATVAGWIREDVPEGPLYCVTHSLGGILLRYLADQLPWARAVMLAPPNSGSRVAAALKGRRLFEAFGGPAGRELGSVTTWPPPPKPFAVIAGTLGPSVGNPPSWAIHALKLLPRGALHDGTVTVKETRLPGMAAFATVEASHTWIMDHPATRSLVLRFFEHGTFDEDEIDADAADGALGAT